MTKLRLVGVLALILAFAGVAAAQETTSGSITGTVQDTQGAAVPGATITVTSAQGSKTFVSDSQGRFFAPFLVPGTYNLRVELTGFSPVERKGILVRLGSRVELSFTLRVGDIQEVVEVVGAAPVVDTQSTTAGGILDSDQLARLPVGRNFAQTLYLVPGVSDSSGAGSSNPSIGGASGLENNYVVDGVNISNAGYGGLGVYSIVFGSLGTGVTTDFIKETQVKTAGFEAEYGQSTGGVVNVVTKSGGNEFRGSLFGYFQPAGLEAERRTVQTPNGTVNDVGATNVDFGVSLSGPLVKDRLFFFGSFNPQYQTLTRIAPDGFPLRGLGEVDRKRRVFAYAGKLTWQANANHRFDFTAFGDPSKGDSGPQRTTALKGDSDRGRFSEIKFYGGHNQSLRYDGIITPSWLIEAAASRSWNTFEELPSLDQHATTDLTTVPFRVFGGVGFYDDGSEGTNLQLSLKSTHLFNLGGSHQFRYGVQFEDIEYVRAFNRSGPTFALHNGVQTRTGGSLQIRRDASLPGGVFYRITRANFDDPRLPTTQKYLNWFAQDTWQIGKRLTVRPGIRWERQALNGVQPICHDDQSQVGGAGTGALIPCEYTWSNIWSPRIGATYDILGNGKSKVYASWGRFYAKIPNDLAARALASDAGVTRADYYDAALTRPIPSGVPVGGTSTHFIVAGLHAALFANDTQSTFSEEFAGGIEFEVARSLSLGVRYIHRDISTVLEDYAQATPVQYEVGFPGLGSVEYIIDNINRNLVTLDPRNTPGFGNIPPGFFEDPVHKYDSVEVTLNKTFADNWSLLASYRWSRLKGNFEGFYRSDNGQSDPSITSLFDFPTNDVSYSSIGVPLFGYRGDIRYQGTTLGQGNLPNDRPHQLKLYATRAWNDINVGLGFNAGSGRRLTALAANPIYANSGEIPETLRGGGFQTVDGFLENTDAEILVDLHVDYTIRLGGKQRLMLIADVFNLFNDQDPTWYDVDTESSFGTLNPNFGQPLFGGSANTNAFQNPRQIRLGARIEW